MKPSTHCGLLRSGALIALFLPALTLALPAQLVEQGKRATALVEIQMTADKRAFGSAFCIDASGVFVTNQHVVEAGNPGSPVKLILSPGEADQRVVEANVLMADKELDLAVVQVTTPVTLTALELGDVGALFDTMDITAFGYPFGGALAIDAHTYPAISVNTGHITSLRKKSGELELIQLDAALNPGNSGGPVLDGAGHVVGIVQAGLPGAGINFAIPVNRLQKLIVKPMVTVGPLTIPYDKRFDPQQLSVKVLSLSKSASYDVELSIRAEGAAARTFTGQAAGGACQFSIVPVPKYVGAKSVFLTAQFDNGSISGLTAVRTVKVGTAAIALENIRRVERKAAGDVVTMADGTQVTGKIAGLDTITLMLGPATITADTSHAQSVEIEDVQRPIGGFAYSVTVRSKGQLVGEASGTIDLAGAPANAVGVPDSVVPTSTADTGTGGWTKLAQGLTYLATFDAASVRKSGEQQLLKDLSGHQPDAIMHGGTLVPGRFGQALHLSGNNEFVDLTSAQIAPAEGAARTICCWVRTTQRLGTVLAMGTAHDTQAFNVQFGNGGPGVLGVMGFADDFYPRRGKTVSDGQWHFIAVVFNKGLTIYVDGAIDNVAPDFQFHTAGQHNYVGRSNDDFITRPFSGDLDDLAVWSRGLSAEEISQVYKAGVKGSSVSSLLRKSRNGR